MLYAFVAPGLLAFLAFSQAWFADARPWVDAKLQPGRTAARQPDRRRLVTPGGHEPSCGWSLPLAVAVVNVLRSEVK